MRVRENLEMLVVYVAFSTWRMASPHNSFLHHLVWCSAMAPKVWVRVPQVGWDLIFGGCENEKLIADKENVLNNMVMEYCAHLYS